MDVDKYAFIYFQKLEWSVCFSEGMRWVRLQVVATETLDVLSVLPQTGSRREEKEVRSWSQFREKSTSASSVMLLCPHHLKKKKKKASSVLWGGSTSCVSQGLKSLSGCSGSGFCHSAGLSLDAGSSSSSSSLGLSAWVVGSTARITAALCDVTSDISEKTSDKSVLILVSNSQTPGSSSRRRRSSCCRCG